MNAFIRDLDEEIHRAAKVAASIRDETLSDFTMRAIKTAVVNDPIAAKILGAVHRKRVHRPRKKRFPQLGG